MHLGQLKKWKSWEPFGSYQLNSTANPAHLPQNRPSFEDFFNCNGCRMFILLEIHWDPCPRIFTTYFWWNMWCGSLHTPVHSIRTCIFVLRDLFWSLKIQTRPLMFFTVFCVIIMKLENRCYSIDAICGAHIVGLMWA